MIITKDYQNGYTKALLDVYQIFTQYERELSHTREISAPTSKKIRRIVDAMIEGRQLCMRYGVKALSLVRRKDKTYKLKLKEM